MNNDFGTLQVYEHFDLLVIKKKMPCTVKTK